jgi:hypothetical protein
LRVGYTAGAWLIEAYDFTNTVYNSLSINCITLDINPNNTLGNFALHCKLTPDQTRGIVGTTTNNDANAVKNLLTMLVCSTTASLSAVAYWE